MKENKILNYIEYIKENIQDTPETYVESILRKLKKRVENMFFTSKAEEGQVKRYGEVKDRTRKEEGKLSFQDLNLELLDIELSKYSKIYDNLKFKFSDGEFLYDVTLTIDLKDAVPTDDTKDFSDKDIKNCQVKFKKYDQNGNVELLGQLIKTAKVEEIDEEFLINLKIELDEDIGGESVEFEIETE